MSVLEKRDAWLRCPAMPAELLTQLCGMDEATLHDCFYRDLTFGTGGLRGVLGAGTNRMNLFTVMKATRGLGASAMTAGSIPWISRNWQLLFWRRWGSGS